MLMLNSLNIVSPFVLRAIRRIVKTEADAKVFYRGLAMDILIACEGEDSLYTAAESAVSTFTFVFTG